MTVIQETSCQRSRLRLLVRAASVTRGRSSHERDITTFENSLEGIVSKRKHLAQSLRPVAGMAQMRTRCAAVKRETEEDWGR